MYLRTSNILIVQEHWRQRIQMFSLYIVILTTLQIKNCAVIFFFQSVMKSIFWLISSV